MDDEHQRAVIGSELGWVEGIAADLRVGKLGWSDEDFEGGAAAFVAEREPPD